MLCGACCGGAWFSVNIVWNWLLKTLKWTTLLDPTACGFSVIVGLRPENFWRVKCTERNFPYHVQFTFDFKKFSLTFLINLKKLLCGSQLLKWNNHLESLCGKRRAVCFAWGHGWNLFCMFFSSKFNYFFFYDIIERGTGFMIVVFGILRG